MPAEEKIKKTFKFPKSMGAKADRLYELKLLMASKNREAKEVEEEFKALKEHIIQNMEADDTGASGKKARVTVVTKETPTIEDYDALCRHIKKTGNFGLLQKRLTEGVINEVWEEGKEVPGVGHFNYKTVSINKL